MSATNERISLAVRAKKAPRYHSSEEYHQGDGHVVDSVWPKVGFFCFFLLDHTILSMITEWTLLCVGMNDLHAVGAVPSFPGLNESLVELLLVFAQEQGYQ